VAVALVGVFALVFTGMSGWRWVQDTQAAESSSAWFAAYADVTVTPQVEFEDPTSTAARDVVLAFVVSSPSNPCQPSWGGDYSLGAASADLDLDRRIARLRQNKGEVVVSFGGAVNDELSTKCTDEASLLKAYGEVVDRYDLRTIDLDLEGTGLADAAANARRATAIKELQTERAAKGEDLRVWLTLPVSPHGLPTEGKRAVTAMLKGGVELSGVNVMTMDYGSSRSSAQSMAKATISALNVTHSQLGDIYAGAGKPLGPATLWKRMGATPMIGQNDMLADVFGLGAARQLNTFARDKGLGRLSMWSLNRDRTCGANYPDVSVVSNSCSGIDQGTQTFAELLRKGLTDEPDSSSVTPEAAEPTAPVTSDDPATSPYPIWGESQVYVEGTRVVWHRNVYVAKWWTSGDVPDDPTVDEFSEPWQLVGPVLPGETPIPAITLPAGTYPEWDSQTAYAKGQRVLFDGIAFKAQWWTQGDSPESRSTLSDPSPWVRLTDTELRRAEGSDG
jgi:chitinase